MRRWSANAFRILMVTGFGIGGSVVNFIAQALIAYRFGAGASVDAFVFSLSVPTFVAGLLALSISYVAVPELARTASTFEGDKATSSAFLAIVVVLAVLLILASIPAMALLPHLLVPKGSEIRHQAYLELLIAIAWTTGAAQVVNALFISRLNAVGRVIPAAMLSMPPGLVAIAVLIAIPARGVWIAAVGVLLGTLAATAVGLWLQRDYFILRVRSVFASPLQNVPVHRSAWLSVAALTCFSSYAVIDSFWAVRLGAGALSTLGYAQRILIGAGNLVALGPLALAVPFLARVAGSGNVAIFRRWTAVGVVVVTGGAGIVAMAIAAYSHEIVALLFQRGAFAEEDVHKVAMALAHLAPGMAAMLGCAMLMRALFCIPESYGWAAAIGLGWSLLYFVLSALLVDRGVTGLADAYSISWGVTILIASCVLWRRAATLEIIAWRAC